GLKLLRQNQIDALFVDLYLPGESGMSVIQKALQIHPNIASVVVTGFGSLKSASEAMRMGACDYLIKPFSREQIIDSLNTALDLIQRRTSPPQRRFPLTPKARSSLENFVYESQSMCDVVSQVKKYSHVDVPVLIAGEEGVGKKTLARLIHNLSPFGEGMFFHVNCAAIKSNGHLFEKNMHSFDRLPSKESSPESQKRTIFLEDVEQLPHWQQKQLLKLLEEGRIQTPCRPAATASSVRLIASTSASLEVEVARGQFYRSLYDNLNILPLHIPPLRDRREEIIPLASHFLEQLSRTWGLKCEECRQRINKDGWKQLLEYHWPGNIQELVSVLSRIVLLEDSSSVLNQMTAAQQRSYHHDSICVPFIGALKSMERYLINEVVKRCGGNKAEAARKLEMHRKTLYRILDSEEPEPDLSQSAVLK
ncbi:MAG: sigma 54-interacting transcriptional regulator, partial [Planctomycetota bacterium]